MAPDTYEELTDRQRTRVVKRDALDEQAATHASIGNTQALSQTKEGLFDGLSIAQIIAGAAAAATSMVLASKIGIGGSVIGAAASSVITVVSSQLYRRFLDASAEKIKNSKDVLPTPSLGSKPHRVGTPTNFATTTRVLGADDELTTRVIGAVDDATRLMGNADEASTTTAAAAAAQSGTRIAPERLQARAEAERAATQRKVIGFSVLAAIVALVATVGIILALTAGEGLGEKTAPIFAPTATEDAPAATDTDANANDAQTDGTEQHNATQAGGSSKTDQGNTDANGNASGNQDASDAPSSCRWGHGWHDGLRRGDGRRVGHRNGHRLQHGHGVEHEHRHNHGRRYGDRRQQLEHHDEHGRKQRAELGRRGCCLDQHAINQHGERYALSGDSTRAWGRIMHAPCMRR